jgi:hypothetical protein
MEVLYYFLAMLSSITRAYDHKDLLASQSGVFRGSYWTTCATFRHG